MPRPPNRRAEGPARLLAVVRRARPPSGPRCPHCQEGHRVHRWGTFSGRQRYRCVDGCRRTFSDFTRTPFAYSKKPHLWLAFEACMRRRETVRAAATRVGIHPCTAFRWRHRILAWAVRLDDDTVSDRIELKLLRFAESRKGERARGRRPRMRAQSPWEFMTSRRVPVVFALDRRGRWVSLVVGFRGDAYADDWRPPIPSLIDVWPTVDDLAESLEPRIRTTGSTVLTSTLSRFSRFGRLADRIGAAYRQVRGTHHGGSREHGTEVGALQRGFRQWLACFHGVGSRYLHHYLLWHRRLADGGRSPPTLATNRTDRRRQKPLPGCLFDPPGPPRARSSGPPPHS
jgi:transposase-like protein